MEPEHAPVDAHAAAADHAAAAPLPSFNLLGWNLDLNDPAFWAFVGLLIFIGVIVYMKVPKTITKSLDDRAIKITSELAAAEAALHLSEAGMGEDFGEEGGLKLLGLRHQLVVARGRLGGDGRDVHGGLRDRSDFSQRSATGVKNG